MSTKSLADKDFTPTNLEELTIAELQQICRTFGISGYSNKNSSQLKELVTKERLKLKAANKPKADAPAVKEDSSKKRKLEAKVDEVVSKQLRQPII